MRKSGLLSILLVVIMTSPLTALGYGGGIPPIIAPGPRISERLELVQQRLSERYEFVESRIARVIERITSIFERSDRRRSR